MEHHHRHPTERASIMSNDTPRGPRLNAPGYQPLRVAAEWAGAVRGEPFPFRYDTRTGRMVVDRQNPEVTTTTVAFARRPLVRDVTFEVPTPEGGTASLQLSGKEASALFWEESAVEKFLLSHYASAAADDASAFLGRVLGAWYGYPARVVQVCALAHLCGPAVPADGTQLSLDDTVGFLCLEDGQELRLLTLAQFEARYDTGLPRGTGKPLRAPEGPQPGWELTPQGESVVARESAEFVSGLRSRTVVFQREGNTLVPVVLPLDGREPAPSAYLFTAMAELVRPDRPAPSRVALWVVPPGAKQAEAHELLPDDPARPRPDSVFWTDGAVETFLLPYYASVKGAEGWFFTAWLIGKWDGLIAPGASARSEVRKVVDRYVDRMTRGVENDEEPTSPVYAITHLPRSEYESSSVDGRTVLLVARGEGKALHSHPLL
jgi:hypothetical protein